MRFVLLFFALSKVGAFIYNLSGIPVAERFEAQVCAGLVSPPVYMLGPDEKDHQWADRLFPEAVREASPWADLLHLCAEQVPDEALYDIKLDHAHLPVARHYLWGPAATPRTRESRSQIRHGCAPGNVPVCRHQEGVARVREHDDGNGQVEPRIRRP